MKSDKKSKAKEKYLLREKDTWFSDQETCIRLNMKLVKVPGVNGFLFQRLPL